MIAPAKAIIDDDPNRALSTTVEHNNDERRRQACIAIMASYAHALVRRATSFRVSYSMLDLFSFHMYFFACTVAGEGEIIGGYPCGSDC